MRHARKFSRAHARVSVAACASVAALLTALPQPGNAAPEPDIESVQERVDSLFRQAEMASERHNDLRLELREANRRIDALDDDVVAQQALVDELRTDVGDMVADEVQGSAFGPTSQLISSGDPDAFLAGLAAAQAYSMRQSGMLESFEAHDAELDLRLEQMQVYTDSVTEAKQEMAQAKSEIDEKSQEAQQLLADLEAAEAARLAELQAQREAAELQAQREAAAREAAEQSAAEQEAEAVAAEQAAAQSPAPPATDEDETGDAGVAEGTGAPPVAPPAAGNAATAVDFALAQVGDAYVYGAVGPDAWDCSGLTMGAWGAAGVSLPHSSGVQAGMGTAVSYSDIQPGDLVFYYSPISHVGMYIGNGQLVHAANPSRPVEVTTVDSMPIATIRRVG